MIDNSVIRRPTASEVGMALLACIAAALIVFSLFKGLRHDDAFVTMQFARNVASGQGFAFNAGSPVFGTTSPLHVLVLAVVYAVFGDVLPSAVILIGALSVAAQAFLLFLLFRPASAALAWLMAAVTLSGLLGSYEFLALETNLLTALILGVIWCLQERRENWCGVLLGVAFLCRYDAVLLVPISVVAWWLQTRRMPTRMLALALLTVAPWLIWAWWYFGAIVPRTLYFKSGMSQPGIYLTHRIIEFAKLPWVLFPTRIGNLLARTTPLFWISGLWMLWRHARQTAPLLAFGGLLVLAYAVIAPPLTQHWHLYPTQLCSTIAFAAGIVGWFVFGESKRAAFAKAPERSTPSFQIGPKLALTVAATMLVASGVAQTTLFARSYKTDFWFNHRHDRYVEISQWLDANITPGRAVLSLESFTIGYLSGFRMIDPYGFFNATNNFPWSYELTDLLEIAERYQADVLVLNKPETGAFFEDRSSFRMVRVFAWDPWSTILVRSPEVLVDPGSYDHLRAELPDRARATHTSELSQR